MHAPAIRLTLPARTFRNRTIRAQVRIGWRKMPCRERQGRKFWSARASQGADVVPQARPFPAQKRRQHGRRRESPNGVLAEGVRLESEVLRMELRVSANDGVSRDIPFSESISNPFSLGQQNRFRWVTCFDPCRPICWQSDWPPNPALRTPLREQSWTPIDRRGIELPSANAAVRLRS